MNTTIKQTLNKTLIGLGLIALGQASWAEQSAIDAIEQANRQLDVAGLSRLSQQHRGYDGSLAHYRLAIAQQLRGDGEAAQSQLDHAMAGLQELVEQEPDNAEAWALLSHVYGFQINFTPIKGAYYGPKAGSSLGRARQLDADNPRVHLVAGLSDYFTPAMFGGSKQGAIKAFDRAIANYGDDGQSGYHWGHAEAYVWRGLAKLELGQTDQALADWRQALVVEPEYPWAQSLLKKHQY